MPDFLEQKKERLGTNETALTAAQAMLAEPFEQEARLAELKEEFKDVTESLAS